MSFSPLAAPPADVAHVTQLLVSRYGGTVSAVTPLGSGAWSRAYAFRLRGADRVVRLSATPDDFLRDRHAMTFASKQLPIPAILDVGAVGDGHFAVSERASGVFLESLGTEEFTACLPSIFATLNAMRTADTSSTTGYGGWNPAGDGASRSWRAFLVSADVDDPLGRTHGWRQLLRQHPAADSVFLRGVTAIAALADACPEARNVVHSDLINRNVLVTGNRVTAVFDWGCGMYGDYLFDVAWFMFWSPALRTIDFREIARSYFTERGADVENFDDRLHCYQLRIGVDHLGYNAFTGHAANLIDTLRRTEALL